MVRCNKSCFILKRVPLISFLYTVEVSWTHSHVRCINPFFLQSSPNHACLYWWKGFLVFWTACYSKKCALTLSWITVYTCIVFASKVHQKQSKIKEMYHPHLKKNPPPPPHIMSGLFTDKLLGITFSGHF